MVKFVIIRKYSSIIQTPSDFSGIFVVPRGCQFMWGCMFVGSIKLYTSGMSVI
jgi:hypothetical protein